MIREIVRSLTYRPAALADLDAIYDFIAADAPDRALTYVDAIRAHCRSLLDHPFLGPARGELGRGIRILPYRGRVVVTYLVQPGAIEIVRIFHAGQDIRALE